MMYKVLAVRFVLSSHLSHIRQVKGAIIYGIAIVSIMSWPRNTSFSYFPHTEAGDDRFNYFKNVVGFHPIRHTLVAQEWDLSGATGGQFALALFTFLYVDILDATGMNFGLPSIFCMQTILI